MASDNIDQTAGTRRVARCLDDLGIKFSSIDAFKLPASEDVKVQVSIQFDFTRAEVAELRNGGSHPDSLKEFIDSVENSQMLKKAYVELSKAQADVKALEKYKTYYDMHRVMLGAMPESGLFK